MISLGIDAGTKSYEVFWLEDDKPSKLSFSTQEVRKNPQCLIETLEEINPDVAAGLSGYGLPVKPFRELTERDVLLMTLSKDVPAVGLRGVISILRRRELPIYTIPGVIHLPTVSKWRKLNRIDMGTYDKLCSTVLAVYEFSSDTPLEKLNFVLVEAGFGFNAFIAVKGGKIVDGIGGTSGFPSYSSLGCMDAELAYLLGNFPKSLLFKGGVSELDASEEEKAEWLAELTLRGVRAVDTAVKADLVAASGRMFKDRNFLRTFCKLASDFGYEVKPVTGFGLAKQSAEGAAIIANGIAGGEFSNIVEHMEILKAKGTILDYLTPEFKSKIHLINI